MISPSFLFTPENNKSKHFDQTQEKLQRYGAASLSSVRPHNDMRQLYNIKVIKLHTHRCTHTHTQNFLPVQCSPAQLVAPLGACLGNYNPPLTSSHFCNQIKKITQFPLQSLLFQRSKKKNNRAAKFIVALACLQIIGDAFLSSFRRAVESSPPCVVISSMLEAVDLQSQSATVSQRSIDHVY